MVVDELDTQRSLNAISVLRPYISLMSGKNILCHNHSTTRFVIQKHLISIGCTDISVEAMEFIYKTYKEKFPEGQTHIIQS